MSPPVWQSGLGEERVDLAAASTTALSGRILEGQHVLPVRVYFEDTDFSGRVYHTRYLQFMERGRSDYLRLLGIHHRELAESGQAFAVRHMEIDFHKPAAIDDVLTVRTATAGMTGARVRLRQEVLKDGEVLVAATVTVALIGPRGRPVKLPAPVREALAGAAPRA
jgi:acyl-CoA thioester hydrolase